MKTATVVLVLLCATAARAQTPIDHWTPPASSESARTVATVISWGAMLTNVAIDTTESWQSDQRKRAFVRQGVRLGSQELSVLIIKRLVHRQRPCAPADCGTDNPDFSFPSGHTAMACVSVGRKNLSFTMPLAAITAEGRIRAKKHWLTDTLAGCGLGAALSFIR